MFRKLSLVMLMVLLLTTFSFAQRIFTLSGLDAGAGQDTIREFTIAGALVNSTLAGDPNGIHHGLSVDGTGTIAFGVSGQTGSQNAYSTSLFGGVNSTYALPNLMGPGGSDSVSALWGSAIDPVTGKAYVMGRWNPQSNSWIGGIQRFSTVGGAFEADAWWGFAWQGFTGNQNPYANIRVDANYIYWNNGYAKPGFIMRLNKNFASGDAPLVLVNENSIGDTRGFAVDGAGNIYFNHSNNIVKYNSAGVSLGNVVVGCGNGTDLAFDNGKLFLAVGTGVSMYDSTSGALLSSFAVTDGVRSLAVLPVPEPSSIFGLLVGGASMLSLLRRKAR
jgi:hypothetical protein